jgi:predicted lipoprotein with Yx(FWY)xxD motif
MGGRAIKWLTPLVLIAALGVGAAMAATGSMRSSGGTVKTTKSSKYGMVLVSSNGRTLYRYTLDKKGVSVCTGACAKFWPPLVVKAGAKPTVGSGASASLLGTIKGAAGERQVTYAGFPLYFFAQDKKAGQLNGQGFEGKWYVVDSKGALVKKPVTSSAPPTTTTKKKAAWG